jgi:Ca2+-binding EF-hand superfamily protein
MRFRPLQRGLVLGAGAALGAFASYANTPAMAVEREMQMMDADRNGTLSAEEHAAGARRLFVMMDANRDSKVTLAEMDAAHAEITGAQPGRPTGPEELSSARKISVIDTDKDGQVSAAEHAAGSKRMFTNMDTDQDGRLTDQELLSGHERLLGTKKY